MQFSDQLQIS